MEANRTTGKTTRAKIAELRQRRVPVLTEKIADPVETLDDLATQVYALIHSMRAHINAIRPIAIKAKQLAMTLKNAKRLDVEL